jgi:hypothetical protein
MMLLKVQVHDTSINTATVYITGSNYTAQVQLLQILHTLMSLPSLLNRVAMTGSDTSLYSSTRCTITSHMRMRPS